MMKTIFDEIRDEGRAEIQAEYADLWEEIILTVLQLRFKKVPKKIEHSLHRVFKAITQKTPKTLKSLVTKAAVCQTLDEFIAAIKVTT